MKSSLSLILLVILLLSVSDIALAKDISAAAASAQAQFLRIGMAAVGIGITIGGICFSIGLSMVGRFILQSGLTGGAIIFALQGILALARAIFN